MPDVYRSNDRMVGKRVDLGNGATAFIPGSVLLDTAGNAADDGYTLASNIPLPAGAFSTPRTGVRRGEYLWDAQWTGAGSLVLEALGSDGQTWRVSATLNAPGTLQGGKVAVGANAAIRIRNTSGAAYSAVYSSLT